MYTVTEEHPLVVKDELEQLLKDHWVEVAKNKQLMVLDPDWDRYQELTDNESMFSLVLRKDGVVVGYSATFIGPHIHYRNLTVASNDVLYVAPHSRGTAALRLMAETVRVARSRGAKLMLWHAKPGTSLDHMLSRTASVQDTVYAEPL